jgi:hypothetical protein
MLKQILELLAIEKKNTRQSENIEIAKGKYQLIQNLK